MYEYVFLSGLGHTEKEGRLNPLVSNNYFYGVRFKAAFTVARPRRGGTLLNHSGLNGLNQF